LQPASQPTEAPEVPNTKKNRSLEGANENRKAAPDDKKAGTDHTEINFGDVLTPDDKDQQNPHRGLTTADNTHLQAGKHETYHVARCDAMHVDVDTKFEITFKKKIKVGRNDEEEYAPKEAANKPPDGNKTSEDINEGRAGYRPDAGANDKPTDERVDVKPPNDDKTSEDNNEGGASYKSDTEPNDNSTKSGGLHKVLAEGANKDHHASYIISACSSTDTSSMKADFDLDFDFEHMQDSLSRVDTTALLAENDHLYDASPFY
jgi:hypothetical protein